MINTSYSSSTVSTVESTLTNNTAIQNTQVANTNNIASNYKNFYCRTINSDTPEIKPFEIICTNKNNYNAIADITKLFANYNYHEYITWFFSESSITSSEEKDCKLLPIEHAYKKYENYDIAIELVKILHNKYIEAYGTNLQHDIFFTNDKKNDIRMFNILIDLYDFNHQNIKYIKSMIPNNELLITQFINIIIQKKVQNMYAGENYDNSLMLYCLCKAKENNTSFIIDNDILSTAICLTTLTKNINLVKSITSLYHNELIELLKNSSHLGCLLSDLLIICDDYRVAKILMSYINLDNLYYSNFCKTLNTICGDNIIDVLLTLIAFDAIDIYKPRPFFSGCSLIDLILECALCYENIMLIDIALALKAKMPTIKKIKNKKVEIYYLTSKIINDNTLQQIISNKKDNIISLKKLSALATGKYLIRHFYDDKILTFKQLKQKTEYLLPPIYKINTVKDLFLLDL